MPNTDLSEENILAETYLVLGGSAVEVELGSADVKLCAKRALREYNRYIPKRGRAKLVVTTSQKRYRVDQLYPNLIGVVDADFITRRVPTVGIDPFDPYATSLSGLIYGGETFGDVMQRSVYAQDAQRIISAEPEWHGQWEDVGGTSQYALYVDVARDSIEMGYTYLTKYADTDHPTTGRLAIPASDVKWVLDYTAALAQRILGRVRGKHGGIVGPEGNTDPTDSDSLLQEAAADLEALIADIKMRRPPGVPVIE